jgi:hypothetical protein
MAAVPGYTAWGYVLLWPTVVIVTFFVSRRLGSQSAADVWCLAGGLLAELVLAFTGLLSSGETGCVLGGETLLISSHVGNIVTSASFAVACLSAYLTFSGPTLATWVSLEADETLRHYGLNKDGKYLHLSTNAAGHAVDVFEACRGLPLTLKQLKRLKVSRGQGEAETVDQTNVSGERWVRATQYLSIGRFGRRMIEGRGDQWLAAATIWLMIFITGQALVLFLAEVIVGDRRVACWLSKGRPFFNDLPIEVGYAIAFFGVLVGVGLFRFRIMIQSALETRLAVHAHDLSLQVYKPDAIALIARVGA